MSDAVKDLLERLRGATGDGRALFMDVVTVLMPDPPMAFAVRITRLLDVEAWNSAALALVEAKLPGWGWSVTSKNGWSWACVNEPSAKVEIVRGEAPTPALALLIALLEALKEQA